MENIWNFLRPKKEENKILTCCICGKQIKGSYYGYGKDITCSDECFNKKFWKDALKHGIVIDGKCYNMDTETIYPNCFRGFDGRLFKIQLDDGDIYYTTNLWYNGIVPKEYYKGDNARFIRKYQGRYLPAF